MWCYLAKRWNHRMIHIYDNEINDKDTKKILTELNHDSVLYDHERHLYNTIDDIQLYKVKEYHCGHLTLLILGF